METNSSENIITEQKFAVIMEEVDIPMSPDPDNPPIIQGHSLCSCADEINFLKNSLKQLTSQVNKQNQLISNLKSGLRNAVLSLATCYSDDEINESSSNYHDAQPYSEECDVTTVSELGTSLEDLTTENIPDTYYEDIRDPLQEETSSVIIANKINIEGNTNNRPSSSQAVVIENGVIIESSDDLESTCDGDDQDDQEYDYDDKSYSPSDDDDDDKVAKNLDHDDNSKTLTQSTSNQDMESTSTTTDSSTKPFRCPKCPTEVTYKTRKTFNQRMRRYHSNNPHTCHLCEKVYVKSSSLAHHIHSVHKGNRLQCSYCPGSFVQLGKLRVHEKIHLERVGPPLQSCKICGMKLRTKKSLLAHLGAVHKSTEKKHYAVGVKAIKNNRIKQK